MNTACAFAKNPSELEVSNALFATGAPEMTYVPSDGLHIVTQFGCFSSSCDRNASMKCVTNVQGKNITVVADVTWENNSTATECTSDCGFVDAGCDTGPLDPGLYQVIVTNRTMSVVTSGTQTVPCTRDK